VKTVKQWDGTETNLVLHGEFEEVFAKAKFKVDLTVASPPYSTAGHRMPSSPGNSENRVRTIDKKYDKSEDEFKIEDYRAWLHQCIYMNGGVTFWNIPPKMSRWTWGYKPFSEIIWRKKGGFIPFARNGVINQHEHILLFGDHTKIRKPMTSVWEMTPQRSSKHPAPFPIDLPAKAIAHCTNKNDVVFDPFGGSGTTASVAKAMGRRWLTCDISEQYCEWMELRVKGTKVIG
jgi:DNA modification methylase